MTNAYSRWGLYITTLISGSSIMSLELVASRLIAPYAGSTIYTWTNIIGMILVSLTVGYYFGGKLADRKPEPIYLFIILALSAFWILCTGFWSDDFFYYFSNKIESTHAFTMLATLTVFAPPSILLASAYPYIVKFSINNFKQAGSTVGKVYALSTIGSIIGTYFTGYFLIPVLGSTTILIIIGLTLIGCSAFILSFKNRGQILIFSFVILIYFGIPITYVSSGQNLKKNSEMLVDLETNYSKVWIIDSYDQHLDSKVRHLATDVFGVQGSMNTKNSSELINDYLKYFRLAEHFSPKLHNVLMIGGGTYAYPKYYLAKFPYSSIDVVEIDPKITELAYKYFDLKASNRLNIHHRDGRVYLNRNHKTYDAIFIDAFSSTFPPFHLTTVEAIAHIKSALNENGIVVLNAVASLQGPNSKIIEAQYTTYKQHFPLVYLFPTEKQFPSKIQNIILVALKNGENIPFRSADNEIDMFLQQKWEFENQFSLSPLTDDFAPIDRYVFGMLP